MILLFVPQLLCGAVSNFCGFFQRKLRVLTIDALCVDEVTIKFHLQQSLGQIININLLSPYQSQTECFMHFEHLIHFELDQHTP